MDSAGILGKLSAEFGADTIGELQTERCDPFVVVPAEAIRAVARFLRDEAELAFDYLMLVSGVDTGEGLLCVYHLYSLTHGHSFVLKCRLSYEHPELETVEDIWPAADWHERETFDMMGIKFRGHHDLTRILCPEDWDGHPLRKSYRQPEEYHGIAND
ncbi:NADH-quinone oxidoreductase subunit C [Candidatus Sumerlaeota bacterium]